MSLRARLLVGLIALTAVGLAVAGFVTYEEQRSFLYKRLDMQVEASATAIASRLGVSLGAGDPHIPAGPQQPRRYAVPGRPGGGYANPAFRNRFGPRFSQPSGTYGELLGPGGSLLRSAQFSYGESTLPRPDLPATFPRSSLTGVPHLFTVGALNSSLRYRVAAMSVSDGRTLVAAVPLSEVDQTLHRLIVVELLVAAGVIAALMALGWLVIRVGLRPLERIGRTANEISHGDLSQRVSPTNPRTEVGRLGISLNGMLGQIEQAFDAQRASEDRLRQFLADASHELRTPLASVRGYLELIRIGAVSDPQELRRVMSRVEAETERMGGLIEDLLLLARLDELPEVEQTPVDMRILAEHAVQDAQAVAPDREISLCLSPGELAVVGAPNQLRQVLGNLLSNAISHTPADAAIEVAAVRDGAQIVISVRDHGPGLPPGTEDQVFDRFWRQELGRSRDSGGAGLGLAIVYALVQAHHGTVRAENAASGGAVFIVRLPVAPGTNAAGTAGSAGAVEAEGAPSLS